MARLNDAKVIRTGDKFFVRKFGNVVILKMKNETSDKILESKVGEVDTAFVLFNGVTKEIKVRSLEEISG